MREKKIVDFGPKIAKVVRNSSKTGRVALFPFKKNSVQFHHNWSSGNFFLKKICPKLVQYCNLFGLKMSPIKLSWIFSQLSSDSFGPTYIRQNQD